MIGLWFEHYVRWMCFQILKRDFDSSRQVHRQQQVEKRGWKRRERWNVSWETHRRREHVARGRPLAYLQGGWILSVFSLTRNHKKPVWHTCMPFLNMLMIVTVSLVIPHVLKCGKGVTMMESITKTHKTTGYSKILCVIWAKPENATRILGPKDTTSSTHVFDISVFGQPVACFAPSSLFVARSSVKVETVRKLGTKRVPPGNFCSCHFHFSSFLINPTKIFNICNCEDIKL